MTSPTATWDGLVALTGRADFLYVADSKLATRANMAHIAGDKGRFVAVLPATAPKTGPSGTGSSTTPRLGRGAASAGTPKPAGTAEPFQADPPARVADVACGAGQSSIALARAYPKVRVDGLDPDAPSIARARDNLAGTDVADRVTFAVRDAADPQLQGSYDAAFIFEALHDIARPVDVLRATRRLLTGDGSVIIGDERVAERFTAPGDEVERLMYVFSVLHCLPAGRADTPSAATGTVLRPHTVRNYATQPASTGSRSCPSTTTSGASTACQPRRSDRAARPRTVRLRDPHAHRAEAPG